MTDHGSRPIALLVMAKRPAPGQTKTRLVPPLTPETAAALYRCFLLDILETVRTAARHVHGLTPAIAYAPPTAGTFFAELAPDFLLVPQLGEKLGDRLQYVLSHTLSQGFEHVLAINSDSPTLPVAYLVEACRRLANPQVDAVFGPCEDGGYYLIGVKRPPGRLVTEVQMSTPSVLQETLAIAAESGLRVTLLPAWYDVDNAEELARLQDELGKNPTLAAHSSRFLQERQQQGQAQHPQ